MFSYYNLLYEIIKNKKLDVPYWIPKLWITEEDNDIILDHDEFSVKVEPFSYFKRKFEYINNNYNNGMDYQKSLSTVKNCKHHKNFIVDNGVNRFPGDWIIGSSIYAFYVRSFTTYDHNKDNKIGSENTSDITINDDGIRETGTFLKAISLLPYIKNLGFNTIYLLPISMVGKAYKKGELGSPYSVKNYFKLDPTLHDPLIDEIPIEMEFKAFIEAAHILGMRVIIDFVLRTASRDSDFVLSHPEWFYWIEKNNESELKPPHFTEQQKKEIMKRINIKSGEYIEPDIPYKKKFHSPPQIDQIKYINESQGYIAKVSNKELYIPGVFSDWPLEDNQPLWNDCTYLKLYTDGEFNYIAYNTIRFYDKRINKINHSLWEMLINVIPYYQNNFGIDGARIDMSHALPEKLELSIIEKARSVDPDFCFISENFDSKENVRSRGYNISYGDTLWALSRINFPDLNNKSYGKVFISNLRNNKNPILGAPESLDTPRAASRKGGIKFTKASWLLVNTLPNMIPYCSSGFELGDSYPLNLGIDFNKEEIEAFSKKKLGYFDRVSLNWHTYYKDELINFIRKMNSFREEYKGVITNIDNFVFLENYVDNYDSLSPLNPVISFIRIYNDEIINTLTLNIFGEIIYPIEIEHDLLFVINMDFENEVITSVKINRDTTFINIFNNEEYKTVSGELNLFLKAGEFIIARNI